MTASEQTPAELLLEELTALTGSGKPLERGSDLYERINTHLAALDGQYLQAKMADREPPALAPDDERLQLAYTDAMQAGHLAENALYMKGLSDRPRRPQAEEVEVS
jgi:hypothetical protein